MDKVARELAALHVVYDVNTFTDVWHLDRPDFVLRRRADSGSFGVEVTDAYASESDARLHHLEGYAGQLFQGGRYRHRNDAEILKVTSAEIMGMDGMVKASNVPAILQELPSPATCAAKLAGIVRGKDARFDGFDPGLAHVNLIICDYMSPAVDESETYSVRDLVSDDLREALLSCRFREVFLIGRSSSGGERYRPLRMLVFLSEFEFLLGALGAYDGGALLRDLDVNDLVPLFAEVASDHGLAVTVREHNSERLVVFGNWGIRYREEAGVQVLDLQDAAAPGIGMEPVGTLQPERLAAFKEFHTEFRADHDFGTAVLLCSETG